MRNGVPWIVFCLSPAQAAVPVVGERDRPCLHPMRHIDHESTIGVGPTLTEPRLLVHLSENKARAAAARFAFAVHAPGLNANARDRSHFDGCIFQSLIDGYTL